MRRCSILLVITEEQIKTTMKYYIPTKMPKLKDWQYQMFDDEMEERHSSWWWGNSLVVS